jgi:biopolymer transport protein ExbD
MKELEPGLAADINVTPMIDVLLVLLVIFMLVPRKRALVNVSIPPDRAQAARPCPRLCWSSAPIDRTRSTE